MLLGSFTPFGATLFMSSNDRSLLLKQGERVQACMYFFGRALDLPWLLE